MHTSVVLFFIGTDGEKSAVQLSLVIANSSSASEKKKPEKSPFFIPSGSGDE